MKCKFLLFLLCCLLICFNSYSQLHWTKVDSCFGKLPSSLNVYRTTDALEGRPFIAYYAEARLAHKKLDFTTQSGNGKSYTPNEYYHAQDSPLLVVNGTFFSFQTNQNMSLLVKNKKILSYNITSLRVKGKDSSLFYYPTRSAIGISKQRSADVAWTFTDSATSWVYAFEDSPVVATGKAAVPNIENLKRYDWKKWKVVTAIGGGPALIHDGRIQITNKEEQILVGGEEDRYARTAMGYTPDGRLIILVVQGRFPGLAEGATLLQEANILLDLGCYEAINLDGGGSSCLLINGKETIQPGDKEGQRAVPGVFMIRLKKR